MGIKNKKAFSIIIIIVLTIVTSIKAFSQHLPAFEMKLTNGKIFSSKKLLKSKPLIIIYFAPDCEHCQLLMDSIFKKINLFKNAQMILATFKPLNELADFENHYHTHTYNNINTGTEVPVFFFRKYYDLQTTPFTALYNKKGNLVIEYKKFTPVSDLLKHLQQLK